MGLCKDPRLTYLNDEGYNVVRLPRKGITPLGIIGHDHKSKTWLGTLDQIWRSELPVPKPGDPQPTAGITGKATSDIKLSFGLEILANAVSGIFGGTAPSIDFAYGNAKSVQFVFREVQSVGIDPFAIGNFLAKGDLASNPFVKKFFTGEKDVEALVVTEVLQSKSIGVIGKRDSDTSVSVNVPQIQAALGAKVSVKAANSNSSEITYEGTEFLTFGFKVFGIGIMNGEWQVYGVTPDEGLAFAVGDQLGEPFVSEGELVDIEFEAAAGV